MNSHELFQTANLTGYVKIGPGLYLSSHASVYEEQKAWLEVDSGKNLDLCAHPLWLTTDDTESSIDINDETELTQLIARIERLPSPL
jgi:hypothetical protein